MGNYYHNAEFMFQDFEDIDKVDDLRVFIDGNKLTIDIIGLKSRNRGQGVSRNLLKYFKEKGFEVCPHLPLKQAMSFWRKMYDEKLIVCNPDELEKYTDV